MRISVLTIGAIASVLTINAFADPVTITTQDYVDNKFQEKIPAGSFGANNSVVTYDANSGDVQERLILHPKGIINETALYGLVARGDLKNSANVTGMAARYKNVILGATDEQYDNALLPAIYVSQAMGTKQAAMTGTVGSVPVFNGVSTVGGSLFTERAIYDGSTTYDSTTDTDKLVTAGVIETKQNKMTCTRYLDNAEETDENCLLWSIN